MAGGTAFSEQDVQRLERTLSVREMILNNLMSTAPLPTKPRDIEAYVGLAESMDRSIIARAKISIDEASNRVNEATKDLLSNLLVSLHNNDVGAPKAVVDETREAPTFTPTGLDVNSGELIRKQDTATLKDILPDTNV